MGERWEEYMNVTPEQTATLIQGMTPVQAIIMILLGVIAIWGIISIVRWIIKIKIGTLPEDIREIKKQMGQNAETLIKMEGKLWSESKVKDEFAAALEHHKMECPAWRKYCSTYRSKENND